MPSPSRAVFALLALLLTLPLAAGARALESDELYVLPFSSGAVDPARDWAASEPREHDLVLVQWTRFGDPAIVDAIAATDVRLVQPLAPVSYLVWADAAQTLALRRLAGVRFAGVLPAAARVSAGVTNDTTRLRLTLVGRDGLGALPAREVAERQFTDVAGAVVEVDGGVAAAHALAASPRVYSVAAADDDPQPRDEQSAMIVATGTKQPLQPGYKAFLRRIGADGTGVVVSHVDTGADLTHPDLSGRAHVCMGYGVIGSTQCSATGSNDVGGHGTHTLGIILGAGNTPLSDTSGFNYGIGMAPGATALVQNAIGSGSNAFSGGYRAPYQAASQRGAVVSGNSWGPSGRPRGYDANTQTFDAIVRDADQATAGDQPMALVFSIMNGSGGTSTQGTPDEGKNIIGIGASGSRGRGVDDLCTCTAHGPALDGRLLPTLVAPGQGVISTKSSVGISCAAPSTAALPPSPLHSTCTGTSMASPHVTGGAAVFIDWYRDRFDGATPSPALVKAAFVNGADDLAGGLDADGRRMAPIPNNQQGWGRFNLGNVMDAWTGGTVHVDQTVVFTTSGGQHDVRVEAVDPTKPLKATLAWTDALGHGLGGKLPAWVNDLDLTVTAPDGTRWLGNVFADGTSRTGGLADRRNNVENVYLPEPGTAAYTVSVAAVNVMGDALPSIDDPTDQDFALVVTNARPAP